MEKIISLEFNSAGIKVNEHADDIRQGDKGVIVSATFSGKDNVNYIARINITRPDGSKANDILMIADSVNSNKYTKKLDSLWYFAKNGEVTLTVFLVDASGNQLANGQIVVAVQKTDFADDPTITPDQYAELLSAIVGKADVNKVIITRQNLPEISEIQDYEIGQMFYIKSSDTVYNYESATTLKPVGKLDDIIHEIETQVIETEFNVEILTMFKNLRGGVVSGNRVMISEATETKAGVLSASDKKRINGLDDELGNILSDAKVYTDQEITNVKAQLGAHKLSKTADGKNFDTEQELKTASVYYYRGEVHTPDENDFAIVNKYQHGSDPTDLLPARFSFDGEDWTFDFILTELTPQQQEALNSGIDSVKVAQIETNKAKIEILENDVAAISSEVEGKSTVSVSTEEVEGASLIKSINVDGTDYNLGGESGGTGTVKKVNGVDPDEQGEVTLTGEDIALDETEDVTVRDKIIENADNIVDLRARIAGKKSTHILSYNQDELTEGLFEIFSPVYKVDGTAFENYQEFQDYISGLTYANPLFNNGAESIVFTRHYVLVKADYPLRETLIVMRLGFDAGKPVDIQKGDDVYVLENRLSPDTGICPDRWIDGVGSFNAIDGKVDLSGYAKKTEIANMVTTDTEQTITSAKKFTTTVEISSRNDYRWGFTPAAGGAALQFGRIGANDGQYIVYPLGIRPISNNQILGHLNRFARINADEIAATHDGTAIKVSEIEKKRPLELVTSATTTGALSLDKDYKWTVNPTSINVVSFDGTGDHTTLSFIAGANLSLVLPTGVTWAYGNVASFEEGQGYKVIIEKGITDGTYTAYLVLA